MKPEEALRPNPPDETPTLREPDPVMLHSAWTAEPLTDPLSTTTPVDATLPGDGRRRMSGRRAATLLMALAAAGVLGYLLWRERAALLQIDIQNAWPTLLAGQAIFLAGLAIAAWIWGDIMRALGSGVPMRRHIHIYATTYLARLLPGTVWYVVGRGMLYQEEGESARLASVASGAEMLLTMMAGALVAATSGLFLLTQGARTLLTGESAAVNEGTLLSALIAVTAFALLCGAVLHPAFQQWLLRRLRLADTPPLEARAAVKWLLLFAINWLVGAAILYMNARLLLGSDASLSIPYIVFVWSLVGTLSTFVFFLPTNFGLSEIGISLLLSAIMPSSVAVLAAVVTRIVQVVYAAVGCGVIALLSRKP